MVDMPGIAEQKEQAGSSRAGRRWVLFTEEVSTPELLSDKRGGDLGSEAASTQVPPTSQEMATRSKTVTEATPTRNDSKRPRKVA